MTQHIKQTIDFIYNPDNQSKDQLIDSFVVRLKIFERLFSDIKEAKMEFPEQHYLIEGKRGMGKTTLLLRLGYEIENDTTLNTWLIPIVFNEEEYSIRRLYKLWERIAILLEEKNDLFKGLHEEMDGIYSSYENEEDYEYAIFNLLNNRLEERGKKLILFIDNFGDIFSKFNKQEIQRLRTVLQTNVNFRIFAASSTVLEAFYDYKHPFYEFFKVTRLQGLDRTESEELLLKLGETYKQDQIKDIIKNQPGRVEALRRLTGGVIRTIVLLFEIFTDKKEGSAFSDLEAILDRVTPLYKHRMDDLPAQQQEIVEAIALAWDAISVGEISQKTKIISKTVSAQLKQMEKNEIITRKLTSNKNHFYQISERFFNIWYLMRHGRKGDKRKVLWLVRFLEEWCDEGELVARTHRHISSLKNGAYNPNGAYYLTEALASTKGLPSKEQDELIKATREFLSKNNSEYVQHLSESDMELHEKGMAFLKNKKYQLALDVFLKMRKEDLFYISTCYYNLKDFSKTEEYCLKAITEGETTAMFNLAILYETEFKDFSKAEMYYLKAAEIGHIDAIYNLAHFYESKFKDFSKAEAFYLKAVEKSHPAAIFNLALLYQEEFKDFSKAETYYLKAVGQGNVDAMNNLAFLYENEFKDFSKAEAFYLKAVEKSDPDAMFNLALLYQEEFKDFSKAETYYLRAVGQGNVDAMNNLAFLYENGFKDFSKAEVCYLKAIENGHPSAMFNLALLYQKEFKDFSKAETYYLKAVGQGNVDAMNNLAFLYENGFKDFSKAEVFYLKAVEKNHPNAMFNLALLYQKEFKDFSKAETYYLKAVNKKVVDAMNNLAVLYFDQKKNKLKALNLAKEAFELKNDIIIRATYTQILLWNNEIEKSKTIAEKFLYDEAWLIHNSEDHQNYLLLLLAKSQYQFLYDFFTNPKATELNLKDQLKPIWYTLMYYMQDQYPNEYLRMGEELEETVNEIMEKVEQMRKDYA